MSDNIDYDELDKAVNAAISARSAEKEAKKAAITRATQKPAAKPMQRGVVMDFAPRRPVRRVVRPRPVAKPAPTTVTKPASMTTAKPKAAPAPTSVLAKKPAAKPVAAPIDRLMHRPAVKPVAKTVARPTVAAAKPVSRPVATTPARPATPARPTAPAHPAAPAHPTTPAHPQPTASRIPSPRPGSTAAAIAAARKGAPNANNYSLGGRSPFVANTKVEKRPLGQHVPETSASALRSTHNVYSQKSPTRATENAGKHIITQNTDKKSGWLWTLIVIGVIAAGGGVGYLLYSIFLSH